MRFVLLVFLAAVACVPSGRAGSGHVVARSIADLVASSDVVVVGIVKSQAGTRNLARNPNDLAQEDSANIVVGQDYVVAVGSSLKGSAPSEVTVTVARGRGTRTLGTKDDTDFVPLQIGAEYALFLRRLPYDPSALALAIEPSRFRLTDQAIAESPAVEVRSRFPSQPREVFLGFVRSVIGPAR
jgi:hypothetical protein